MLLIETDLNSKGKGIVILHTIDNQYQVNRSLRSFESELSSDFLRVSRYALINLNFIERIDHKDQTLHLRHHDSYVGVGDSFKAGLLDVLRKR